MFKVGYLGYEDIDDDDDDEEEEEEEGFDDGFEVEEYGREELDRTVMDTESDISDATHEVPTSDHDEDDDEETVMRNVYNSSIVSHSEIAAATKNRNAHTRHTLNTYDIFDPKLLNDKHILKQWIEMYDFRNMKIREISGGGYHICVLTDDGTVLSMGWNRYGQLGTGDTKNRYRPTPVKWQVNPAPRIAQVRCSGRHTLLVATDGRLYAMGCGENGRLGLGNTENYCTPQLVKALEGMRVKLVATTFWHSIVSTECNKTFVFGHGEEGKLGIGSAEDVLVPTEIPELRGREVVSASGGAWHTIIATKDRHVYTTGSNYWGQLGVPLKRTRGGNSRDRSDRLTEVRKLRGLPVIKASAGSNFNIVLTADNELYSFGCGSSGKCGLNSKETVRTPRKIIFEHPVKDICNGSNHSIILTKDGQVFTFGWNKYCQLGNGSDKESYAPTLVEELRGVRVSMVASGAFYSLCATRPIDHLSRAAGKSAFAFRSAALADVDIFTVP